jgi:hypothetical protein
MSDITLSEQETERWKAAVQRSTGDLPDAQSNQIYIPPGETRSLPDQSTSFGMKQIQVDSIERLNEIFGIPNTIFNTRPTSDIASLSASVLKRAGSGGLSHGDDKLLEKAADNILFGDSAGFEEMAKVINTVAFPVTLNVVAAITALLGDNARLVVDGAPPNAPQGLYLFVLGSLSLGAGAQLTIKERVVINLQVAKSANGEVKPQSPPPQS